jgi:hypothetical protein
LLCIATAYTTNLDTCELWPSFGVGLAQYLVTDRASCETFRPKVCLRCRSASKSVPSRFSCALLLPRQQWPKKKTMADFSLPGGSSPPQTPPDAGGFPATTLYTARACSSTQCGTPLSLSRPHHAATCSAASSFVATRQWLIAASAAFEKYTGSYPRLTKPEA